MALFDLITSEKFSNNRVFPGLELGYFQDFTPEVSGIGAGPAYHKSHLSYE